MKRKLIAVTLAMTISLSSITAGIYPVKAVAGNEPTDTHVSTIYPIVPSGSAVVNKTADINNVEYVDLSDQIIQEGGFPSTADSPNEGGIMLLSITDDETKKQIQNKLFTAWDSVSEKCDLTEFKITIEELETIYKETINQNPRYFYVTGGYSYSYDSDKFIISVTPFYEELDGAEIKSRLEKYDAVVAQFKSNADPSWSDMEKVLFINDYLARSCTYGGGHSAYDALVEHLSVCSGYALAFRELAQQLGLSCEIVNSSSLNHAWNLVEIDGSYYHTDVTWNDPVEDRIGRARHQYLMKSTDYFKSQDGGHLKAEDWQITGGISEMVASETRYDDYFWNSIDTGFEYIEGVWYGFDGTDSIKKYTYDEMDFISGETIQEITDVWSVMDGSGYWTGKYIGLGALDGYLYYSGTDKIYEFDIESKTSNTLFTLSDEQKQKGYIYGMNITQSGEIQYILAEDPNVSGEIYTVELDSHQIIFNGNGAEGSMENMILIRPNREYTLSANLFTKRGYVFKGWNTEADGTGTDYADQDTISYKSDDNDKILTLYAQWEIETTHINTEIKNKVEATCTEEGYTGDTYCSDCGTLIKEGTIIAATGHLHTEIRNKVEATCTEEGYTGDTYCSDCGTLIEKGTTIAATGHLHTEIRNKVEATNTKEGYTGDTYCLDCGVLVKRGETIPISTEETTTEKESSSEESTTPKETTTEKETPPEESTPPEETTAEEESTIPEETTTEKETVPSYDDDGDDDDDNNTYLSSNNIIIQPSEPIGTTTMTTTTSNGNSVKVTITQSLSFYAPVNSIIPAPIKESEVIDYSAKKGFISTERGIITGEGSGYSEWKKDHTGWWLEFANGEYAAANSTETLHWEMINGSWYSFGKDGYVNENWIFDPAINSWYFIDINAGMQTGWKLINKKWYYFNPISNGTKGKMVTDSWIDDYYINKNGEWEEGKIRKN